MGDPRGPAKRASVLMIVLGSLTLLLGSCVGLVVAKLPSIMSQMPPEQTKAFNDMESQYHFTIHAIFLTMSAALVIVGVIYIVMGIFVRNGGLGSVITSIVFTSVTILFIIVNLLGSLLGGVNGLGGACMCVLALAMFSLLLIFLIQAASSSGRIRMMQNQYQAQYMQYQQMMQQYGQAGYGYSYPPPPPPGPLPPDQSSSPPSS
jgi:hypothetical protein